MGSSQQPLPPSNTVSRAVPHPDRSLQQTNKLAEVPDLNVKSRELATLSELDLSTLDPNFTYRLVHKSPLKVARARARGYIIVDPAHETILNAVGEAPEAEDGTYRVGDTILMKLPKLTHRARRKAQKRKTDKRLRVPERKFRKQAAEKAALRGQDIEVITSKDPEREE
jgi:hypothetical protein